ncbi:hypothetical protein F511_17406 [Dorcoceras hygrometricum]|uniref:Uncharacterized protein n=1 Tax=Dorcoceras hygrometricum TaxID=472368 RepID=A0A2Z7C9I2_9LAMI|nr:hypothetical protein F511_17406 [Dorcoceras hygrometricum]
MSSSTDSVVRSIAESMDSIPVGPETKEPWLPDQAELESTSLPWYEEKSSNLRRGLIALPLASIPSISTNWIWTSCFQSRGSSPLFANTLREVLQCSRASEGGPPVILRVQQKRVERMGKTALLTTLHERPEEGSSGTAAPDAIKVMKKMKAPSSAEKEARHQKKKGAPPPRRKPPPLPRCANHPLYRDAPSADNPSPTREERPASTPPVRIRAIPEVPSSEAGPRTEAGPGRAPALNIVEDSLVVSPSGSVAMSLLCNLIPDRDVARVRNAPDYEAVGLFAAQFAAVFLICPRSHSILCVCTLILYFDADNGLGWYWGTSVLI